MYEIFTEAMIKAATMTTLEQPVSELGVCPRCHHKTLSCVHSDAEMRSSQCAWCKHVWILPSNTVLSGR